MKILIIGYGTMGQTYASSFTTSGFVNPDDIIVLNRTNVIKKNDFQ
jgi:pyrroline-5-carboxylate reductase